MSILGWNHSVILNSWESKGNAYNLVITNPLIPTFDPNYQRDILVPLMNLILNALLKGGT